MKCELARHHVLELRSLPTRGAWIEMQVHICLHPQAMVAPHAGSVD